MATSCKSETCNPPCSKSGSTEGVSPEIIEGCQELIMTPDHLKKFMDSFLDNVNRGLGKDTNADAIVKCFPTYVQNLPDGTEKGKFLALDLGGSNFRVLLIELGPETPMRHSTYVIPQSAMTGPGAELFDFIADCLAKFTKEQGVANENLPLGFTFSFPLKQKGLKIGVLERWTKGFSCPDVIGNDVVQMLKEAIDRRGDIQIDVVAVVNDTTGTLMACAEKNLYCRVGLIVGTGTNACYVEKQSKAELFDEPDTGSGNVIINLEWGAFGDDGALDFCRTAYDMDVDENSINPGRQVHEKMISGMYLGELVRLAVERFTKEGLMFGGNGSDALFTRHSFETKFVTDVELDPPGTNKYAKQVCDSLGLGDATETDYANLRYICGAMSRRAAHLVAAGLTVLIKRVGEKRITIGIDGTLYRNHPHFHTLAVEKIKELLGDPSIKYQLMLSEDGSGRGAALIAAMAVKK